MQLSVRMRGFTIIELAVVLLVVSLLLGSILVPLGSQVKQRNKAETQRALEEARQALIGYAMINGRLPRPSDTATGGAERVAACAAEAECTGFVPWATLGIAPTDAWGKVLRYSVHSSFAGGASGSALITTATFTTAGRTVKTRDAAGAEVIVATNIPAVLVSHGERNLGTTVDGTPLPDSPSANVDEDMNAAAGTQIFWWRTPADSAGGPGGEFDDQVVWITPSQMFSQLVAAGRIP